jgi:hypothetical protein
MHVRNTLREKQFAKRRDLTDKTTENSCWCDNELPGGVSTRRETKIKEGRENESTKREERRELSFSVEEPQPMFSVCNETNEDPRSEDWILCSICRVVARSDLQP